jgi:hypothetical protein
MLPPLVIFTDGSPDSEEMIVSRKILNRGVHLRETPHIALWTLMAFTKPSTARVPSRIGSHSAVSSEHAGPYRHMITRFDELTFGAGHLIVDRFVHSHGLREGLQMR